MPALHQLPAGNLAELAEGVRFLSLATISDQGPVIRSLGSWALDGYTLYFATARVSDKVGQLAKDARISAQLLAEGQEITSLKNLVLEGEARDLQGPAARAAAIAAISRRNPRFRERAEKGLLGEHAIFGVEIQRIKLLDFSKGIGAAALSIYQN